MKIWLYISYTAEIENVRFFENMMRLVVAPPVRPSIYNVTPSLRQKHAEGWTFVTYVHSSRESLLVDVHSVLGQIYVKGYVHTSVCGWYVERGGGG